LARNDKALKLLLTDTGHSGGKTMTELQALKFIVKQYADVTAKLAVHSLIRSHNKPQGDIAEAVAADAFGGTLLHQSAKGADVKLPDGKLLQVKSVTDYGRRKTQTSGIRSTDFDQLLLVVFDPELAIQSACLYTKEQAVGAMSNRSSHTNAHVIRLSSQALSLGTDVTQKLKSAWY
jgi:hypothetical protein